jgi:hypothetical protein
MPIYNYKCSDCEVKLAEELKVDELDADQIVDVMFETRHSFKPSKSEIKKTTQCPRCEGFNTSITIVGTSLQIFSRGIIWEEYRKNNANAIRRDMAQYQLQNHDPYSEMRRPGEASDLAHKLATGGRKVTDKKHFDIKPAKEDSK